MNDPAQRRNIAKSLARAGKALAFADAALAIGGTAHAVSRTYDAALHHLRALLFARGLDPRSHQGAHHLFNQPWGGSSCEGVTGTLCGATWHRPPPATHNAPIVSAMALLLVFSRNCRLRSTSSRISCWCNWNPTTASVFGIANCVPSVPAFDTVHS